MAQLTDSQTVVASLMAGPLLLERWHPCHWRELAVFIVFAAVDHSKLWFRFRVYVPPPFRHRSEVGVHLVLPVRGETTPLRSRDDHPALQIERAGKFFGKPFAEQRQPKGVVPFVLSAPPYRPPILHCRR